MPDRIKGVEIWQVTCEEAKRRLPEYTYGIVHMISEMKYGRLDEIVVNWDELIELRAFSAQEELRVYKGDNGLTAQCCCETGEEALDAIVLEYKMRNGGKLAVKEYLAPDEDGQAVVRYTRPFAMS